jgi:AcrR family transcriptional regulator
MDLKVSDLCAAARPLRADAARNRELILETAAKVFAELGLDAGYDEIARRAGIGVGTVYRRFPQRSELVAALFESRIQEMVAIGEEAGRRSNAWEGLSWFLEKALERQVADRGLKEVMVRSLTDDNHRTIGRERIGPMVDTLTARAHADGTLRSDIGSSDIMMQVMMVSSMSVPGQPDLWRRYLALMLEAMRARPDQPPLPGGKPDDEAMYELMCNLHGRQA